jgi:hypothetical protein
MRDLEKEIQAVNSILKVLNKCLGVYLENREISNAKKTLRDIQIVKHELKKLTIAKAEEIKAVKEKAPNAVQ